MSESSPNLENSQQVKELLKSKSRELLFAPPTKAPALIEEIQRLRVVLGIFREIENDYADDKLYKEMNLLNRMFTGKDIETEAEKRNNEQVQERAAKRLRDGYGAEPESAQRIMRAISAVMGGGRSNGADEQGELGDEAEPEPIDPSRLS